MIYDKYNKNAYFASANTGGGFVNRFDEIFAKAEKKYIIKGGPGTGKSRLMRDLGKAAEEGGHEVEYFLCSSDPDSLDGVLIDSRIGMVDGTPPHISEPEYPGAVGNIVNLGDFWDSGALSEKRDEIKGLTDEKGRLYSGAYRYLASVRRLEGYIESISSSCIRAEKLVSAAERLTRKCKSTDGELTVRLTESYSMKGCVMLPTLEKRAETTYLVTGRYCIAHIFLKALLAEAVKKKSSATVCYSADEPNNLSAVYLPDISAVFVTGDERNFDRVINMERFCDLEKIRQYRQRIRFAEKCSAALKEETLRIFCEIGKIHFRLEDIYSDAMDFEKKEEYCDRLIEKIIKEAE